jgi:hypothetical protein
MAGGTNSEESFIFSNIVKYEGQSCFINYFSPNIISPLIFREFII